MPENEMEADHVRYETDVVSHFMSLKREYDTGREKWTTRWQNALAAYNLDKEQLLDDRYISDSKFVSPKPLTKLMGIVARKVRILFNVEPFGRIEDSKVRKAKPKSLIDLWNRYIFNYQIQEIKLKQNFRIFEILQCIFGVAVAYIPHEFEEKTLKFADDNEITVEVKNDTYFQPILTGDFYTDPTKLDLRESDANILAKVVNYEDLKALEKRTETFVDTQEMEDGSVLEIERREEIGVYSNLDKVVAGADVTSYQEQYLKPLYYNNAALDGSFDSFDKYVMDVKRKQEDSKKTGKVHIDVCFGRYWFEENGEWIYDEVICEIANGTTVIRIERTPYQHTRYIRPFLAAHQYPMKGSFYCHSQITAAMDLWMELNANRQMRTDSKKRSIFPQTVEDTTKMHNWDGTWRKDGRIKVNGSNAISYLVNPNLQHVTNEDNVLFESDIDSVFNLSQIQEGTSDRSKMPGTARGTAAIIAQNDVPLNDKINDEVEEVLKPFLEILFERNLQFKTLEDLLEVWEEEDVIRLLNDLGIEVETAEQADEIIENFDLTQLFFKPSIKILGNMELSNEVAHQAGYTQFLQFASTIPPIAKRLDWLEVFQKMLRSYGIKDDSEGMFLSEEAVQKADELNAQQQQQEMQAQKGAVVEQKQLDVQEFGAQEGIKTQNKIVEMEAEVLLERNTGQKVM